MTFRHFTAAEAGHPVFGQLESGFHGLLAAFDVAAGGYALFDDFQQVFVPGFEPYVQSVEPCRAYTRVPVSCTAMPPNRL